MAIRKRLRWLECRRELWLHLWETTPWQSMLIFMKEFFWINEKPLCSLSEVFLIIWTLFSLHATLYQKFIKTFFFFALLLLVLCFPIDIPLFMFASTSADFQKGHQSFAETEWSTPRNYRKDKNSGHANKLFITSTHWPDIHVRLQEWVDAIHYPAEQASVQGLGHGVSDIGGFVHGVGADDGFAPRDHTLRGKCFLELLGSNAEERRSWEKGETVNQFHSEEITASYHNTIITNMVILQIFKVESGKIPFSQILQHYLKSTAQWSQTHIKTVLGMDNNLWTLFKSQLSSTNSPNKSGQIPKLADHGAAC